MRRRPTPRNRPRCGFATRSRRTRCWRCASPKANRRTNGSGRWSCRSCNRPAARRSACARSCTRCAGDPRRRSPCRYWAARWRSAGTRICCARRLAPRRRPSCCIPPRRKPSSTRRTRRPPTCRCPPLSHRRMLTHLRPAPEGPSHPCRLRRPRLQRQARALRRRAPHKSSRVPHASTDRTRMSRHVRQALRALRAPRRHITNATTLLSAACALPRRRRAAPRTPPRNPNRRCMLPCLHEPRSPS